MSNYYKDVYLKRLNRYGLNYQSRIQNQREREFEDYLLKSVYRVDIELDGNYIFPATFEKYKQDETKTLHYLLTRKSEKIPNGTILWITDLEGGYRPWMVYYLEDMQVSGYNRYIMLKMTHHITWMDEDGNKYNTLCYLYGQEDNMLRDEIRSRSRMDTLYAENLKSSFIIMPYDTNLHKEDLIFLGRDEDFEQYRVTGYDRQSSLGVMYVTIDPTYAHDITAIPERKESDTDDDFFWLTGGESDAN